MKHLLLLTIIAFTFSACNQQNQKALENSDSSLGVLEHDFDISAAAQEDFEKGLLLIHSFEYDDALTAFQAAKEKDSTEVMAYWGEAMSHYKALWGLQDKRAGYAVIEQLGLSREERMASIEDPLEKDFWEGVEILYGDGSLKYRNAAFNDHMEMLSKKYPGNQEARAFFALSTMWDDDSEEKDIEKGKRAAAVAQGILEENPLHPGALHYTIHAYDNPINAHKAMDQARDYSKVAPDASHALHMPSHIFLAQGMWPDVVASNEESYAASVRRMERLGLTDEARGYHSYAWLHYAYLQQGRVEEATRLLADIAQYFENTQSKSIRSYIASMQAAQLFETGQWPEQLEVLDVDKSDLGLSAQYSEALFDAQMAYHKGNNTDLEAIIDHLKSEIEKGKLYVSQDKASMCSAGPSRYAPNEEAIKESEAVLHQIYALKAKLESSEKDVESFLQKAVALEADTDYSFGPIDIPLPSFERYGYWLIDHERYEEALDQFEKSLERAPNRRNAMMGMKIAYEKLGDHSKALSIEKDIKDFSMGNSSSPL
ncbi:tetratricopeptide repeat protein [Portibacter marinus]|uniref:hypothetical protein n=1 Tax=Portibacter marinus TaxID=2898660 RepID=UPI001F179DA7|nr:hypothetical protein [Portibacter marinus]